MQFFLSKSLPAKTCGHHAHHAHALSVDLDGDGLPDRVHLCPDCWRHHRLHEFSLEKSLRLADGLHARIQQRSQGRSQIRKSHHPPLSPGDRWITVHPHGEDTKGHAVLLHENRDGSHTIKGGAGGKLNGLRLTGVKDPGEYKHLARDKAKAKVQKQKETEASERAQQLETHRAAVAAEHRAAGREVSDAAITTEATHRVKADLDAKTQAQQAELERATQARRTDERAMIDLAAKTQGWDGAQTQLSEDDLKSARENLRASHLDDHADWSQALQHGSEKARETAHDQLEAAVARDVERLQDAHHAHALARAREVLNNHGDALLADHETLCHDALGDLAIGDIVRDTFGDSGKGYVANLTEQARARGMDLDALPAQAEAVDRQSEHERESELSDRAGSKRWAAQQRAQAQQAARERIARVQEKLGESGGALENLKTLDTTPGEMTAHERVQVLAQAKQLEAKISATREHAKAVKAVKDAKSLDTLPTAAVVRTGAELSPEAAREQVHQDLSERNRQRAMGDLLDLYNVQDEAAPLRSHLLSGHNAYFSHLGQVACENGLGVRAPDPLVADILGAAGTAAVMHRALTQVASQVAGDAAALDGLREALGQHHVETQVKIADDATTQARAHFDKAEKMEEIPLDSMESRMAAVEQNQQRLDALRQGREQLGVALGRLEGAAAMNWALGQSNSASNGNDSNGNGSNGRLRRQCADRFGRALDFGRAQTRGGVWFDTAGFIR